MIHVCHVRDMPKEPSERHVYCGRKYGGNGYNLSESILHNQFTITEGLNRDKVISMFDDELTYWLGNCHILNHKYLGKVQEFYRIKRLASTGDLYLYCWCAPQPCHCDVIKAELEARL